MHSFDRRHFFRGVGAFAVGAFGVGAARAKDALPLDGTWAGALNGVTAQVIVAGNAVAGFFWRKSYRSVEHAQFSADGMRLSFAFAGGAAILTRTGEVTATIEVRERNAVLRLPLKRD